MNGHNEHKNKMLQEIQDLQNRAVSELFQRLYGSKTELTFRAPIGSGKTRMMADLMNRVFEKESDVVFLVSSLSKGDLARQNYLSFCDCVQNGVFPLLNPCLISTEVSGEETLFIPTDHNVYVLPRDLFKKNGKLMAGAMNNFLARLTEGGLFGGLNKRIYLIKDECHQATNNLDTLSARYFSKTINISATPNLRRGQTPDVQITDDEAVQAKLIKRVELGADTDTVEDALCRFEKIQQDYTSLEVNPCLIIQISNKDKADREWQEKIRPALDRHQGLKWMLIVDNPKMCDTNDDLKKLKPGKWKDYARRSTSSIDVIIFKMTISEGWDIPRACMLYQVRDSQSKQLDEQVMGRVRRNPRLTDFETLTPEQKELATTAWVWGIPPDTMRKTCRVALWNDGVDIRQNIALKTTYLLPLTARKDFDVSHYMESKTQSNAPDSIFALYRCLQAAETALQDLCYQYTDSVRKWLLFAENLGELKKQYNQYICNYDESMVVSDKPASFPVQSYYLDSGNRNNIRGWVWHKKTDNHSFAFDSDAESEWASVLQDAAEQYGAVLSETDLQQRQCYLWGKNYLPSSEICYEYYTDGIHLSYPDFVMKDRKGRIHIFEIKSVNIANDSHINTEEYNAKICALKACYAACSKKLQNHLFYLPVLKDDIWRITRFCNGIEDTLSKDTFLASLK